MQTHKKRFIGAALLVLAGALWGCTIFAPVKRVQPAGELPHNFSLYAVSQPPQEAWWQGFKNLELDQLIQRAMGDNFTIREAKARLDQAKAGAMKTGAQQLPQLNYEATAATTRSKTETLGETSGEDYSLGLSAAYELDLWGRIRSQRQAALLDEAAVKEDLNAAAMTIAAEVALRWTGIITQRLELKILRQQLETNQTLQELVDLRFRKGMVSSLDVYQQKQAVAGTNASIPLVELKEIQLTHELAQLLGLPATARLKIQSEALPQVAELTTLGIPADLLANRPDVRGAGLRLQSADWQVSAARADRLPALRLTAKAAYASTEIGTLFDNWLLNLMGSLTGPIFDGHSRKAEVLRTRAVAQERVAAYGRVVFNAIKEVEDALAQEEKHQQHLKALETQLEISRNALREASQRYTQGLNDYLPVLTQLLAGQKLERDILQMQQQVLADRIQLYRALGGGWTEAALSPDDSHQNKKGQDQG